MTLQCDRGQPCSNCLLREVECVYENPQPSSAAQPVVRSQSFMIATLRRDAAQLIARLGLSQKEVERLALEADRQLAEEAAALAQPARPHTSYQSSSTPRIAAHPYPGVFQRRPSTAPQHPSAPSHASSAGGSPQVGYASSPMVRTANVSDERLASVVGPMRHRGTIGRPRSDTAPSSYATGVPPSAVGAAMRPPTTTSTSARPSPHLIHADRPCSSSSAAQPKPISVLFTPPIEVATAPAHLAPTEPPTPTVPVTVLTRAAQPPSPNTLSMPPPRAPARRHRPARITLPLPATGGAGGGGKDVTICLTPGWLSLRPIRAASGVSLNSPSVPTPSPSKWRFSGLPSITHLAPGWAILRRESGVRMEVD